MSELLILRGPTKSGKSSIAKELCERMDFKDVDIDKIGDRIPQRPPEDWMFQIARYGYVLCEAYTKIAEHFDSGFDAILEEAFAARHDINCLQHLVIDRLSKRYSLQVRVFYIWCTVEVALERNRSGERILADEVVRHQHSRFSKDDGFGILIDTSTISSQKAVDVIQRRLKQKP